MLRRYLSTIAALRKSRKAPPSCTSPLAAVKLLAGGAQTAVGRARMQRGGAPGGMQGVSDVAWDSTSKYLATASDDCTLRLWDAEQGSLLRVLVGHAHYVMCCAFNPAGGLLVRRPLQRYRAHCKSPHSSFRALRHKLLTPAAISPPDVALRSSWQAGVVVIMHSQHFG